MRRPSLLDGAIRAGGDPQHQHLQQQQERQEEHRPLRGEEEQQEGHTRRTSMDHLLQQQQERQEEHRPLRGEGQQQEGQTRRTSIDLSIATGGSACESHLSSTNGSAITSVTSNITHKVVDPPSHQNRNQRRSTRSNNSGSTRVASNLQSDAGQPLVLRHVDDDCSAPDYEINLFFQLCEVTLQPVTATSKEATRWANIRRWFIDHRGRAERYAACVQQGVFSTTPLHFVCQHPNCPLDIVTAVIAYGGDTISWEDTNGWLPLHYACAKNVSIEVLESLANAYPDGNVAQDKRMRTPLHFVFYKNENDDEIDLKRLGDEDIGKVVNLLHRAIMVGDEKGRLPIHFAAAYGTSEAALEALLASCPRSLYAKENTGRTPLHYAMANAHNDTSPQVLRFLLKHLENDSVDEVDDEGNLPLHLMALRVEGMDGDTVFEKKSQENVKACLKIYLDSKPTLSADFLTALQSLPGWLRDDAVTHSHVQKILNQRIAGRFPTFILLLDGYLYILIIACFSYATRSHIHFRFGAGDLPFNIGSTIGACIFGATYFLIREMVKVASMISLNTIRSWFVSFESWMNIIVISLIYYYSGAMQRRERELDTLSATDFPSQEDFNFRTGAAFTLGTLWLSVINFLKSTMLEFSVFYETVLYVTKKLFIFMISLTVILIAFAQMFLIVFRKTPVCSEECVANNGGFPHCSFSKSFLKVYTMMLGEIGEVNRYQQSLTAQILYVAFVFVVVILLSNVLIAIVTDSHSVVKNERAEMVFWSNRLDFVAEMDTIDAMRYRLVARVFRGDYSVQDHDSDRPQQPWTESFREYWDHLITFLKEANSDDTNLLEYYLFLLLRLVVVLLVIPLWIGLGLFTAGFFWPPQIREWLFVMREGGHQDNTAAAQVDRKIQSIEDSISQTKSNFLIEVKRVNDDHDGVVHAITDIKHNLADDIPEIKRLSIEMTLLAKDQNKRMRGLYSKKRSGTSKRRSGDSGSSGKSRSNVDRITRIRGDRSD